MSSVNSSSEYLHRDIEAIAQSVRNLPAMQETQCQFLGQKDPLEKEMATHSSILAWGIPWTEEPDRLQSVGSQELDTTKLLLLKRLKKGIYQQHFPDHPRTCAQMGQACTPHHR